MNTGIVCEECGKPHPQMVEVKVTAIFKGRTNEWKTHFCPKCLDYMQKQEDIISWRKRKNPI